MTELYAIWHKPGEEWITDHSGRVVVFVDRDSAESFRRLIDVEPPLSPENEVKPYNEELDTIRYEQLGD